MPKISVIIPALNEEKYIAQTLKGLKKQTFKDFEVIVADGNSTDKTREMARKYGAKVVIEKRKGMSVGRNAGAKRATGEILVFLDADTTPSRGLLQAYSQAFSDGVIAATGPILPLEKVDIGTDIGYKIVSILFVKASIMFGRPSIVGSNFAVTRRVFEKVHGFNSRLKTYEDWDLSLKLKRQGKIIYLDDALVHTSARRVMAWGVFGYFVYHIGNMITYTTVKKVNPDYPAIR